MPDWDLESHRFATVNSPSSSLFFSSLRRETKTLYNDASENVLTRVRTPPNMKDRYDNPAIHYLMKQHEGKRYLITVNSAHQPVQAACRIAAPVESIREIPSNREVEVVRGGSFADTNSPLGVHVYEIALK